MIVARRTDVRAASAADDTFDDVVLAFPAVHVDSLVMRSSFGNGFTHDPNSAPGAPIPMWTLNG